MSFSTVVVVTGSTDGIGKAYAFEVSSGPVHANKIKMGACQH